MTTEQASELIKAIQYCGSVLHDLGVLFVAYGVVRLTFKK